MAYEVDRHWPAPRRANAPEAPSAKRLTEAQGDALMLLLDPEMERERICNRYPEGRPRPEGAAPSTVQKFGRYEEVTALAGTGGAFAEIGTFSGQPDDIDLLATGGDALVRLTDRTNAEESSIRLVAGVVRYTHISRERVLASNVSDASPATVRATGKWAEPRNGDTE